MNDSHSLPFRQVHLDFHTSAAICGIGSAFDKEAFKSRLSKAHVDSITLFSTCHHGWSYHPTKVGAVHPGLGFDLLGAQIEACEEAGIRVQVYISAGLNQRLADLHPEWRECAPDGARLGWRRDALEAGYDKLCLNSPYLDELCALTTEVASRYPKAGALFFDIISQGPCCCPSCLSSMDASGLDPASAADRAEQGRRSLRAYYERVGAAVEAGAPGMRIFHNSGHVPRGRRELFPFFSHYELESLPTWSWGYDHFPTSARYVDGLGKEFLGMTGKFHTTWGEFGGYKHPNALRYECSAMLANGARCSIGDQLHPDGELDEGTYDLIGAAYGEVEAKEAWCAGSAAVADVAVFSRQAFGPAEKAFDFEDAADAGAVRLLSEEHFLFDLVDRESDLSRYKLAVVPDGLRLDAEAAAKLRAFFESGGAVFLCGLEAFDADGRLPLDLGLAYEGVEEYCPTYLEPGAELAPAFAPGPIVSYGKSARVRATDGESLAAVILPYFNRGRRAFSSHQHTPYDKADTPYSGAIRKGRAAYFAHPAFSQYRALGSVAQRVMVGRALDALLGDGRRLRVRGLPSAARVSLRVQAAERRSVLHLLYAPVDYRGGGTIEGMSMRSPGMVGIIEDLPAIGPFPVEVDAGRAVKSVRLVPEGRELSFSSSGTRLSFELPSFSCHQMVELAWQ
jgi:hypothetical protein